MESEDSQNVGWGTGQRGSGQYGQGSGQSGNGKGSGPEVRELEKRTGKGDNHTITLSYDHGKMEEKCVCYNVMML